MLEYVYKLNLPKLQDVVRDEYKENLFPAKFISRHGLIRIHPKEYLHENYLNFMGLEWDRLTIFNKKPGVIGDVHTDNADDNFKWSINWVVGSGGGMHYWEDDEVRERIVNKDGAGIYRAVYKVDINRPSRTYRTEHNCVYLVNASKVHAGFNDEFSDQLRFAAAIKAVPTPRTVKWEDVVNLFQPLIIS